MPEDKPHMDVDARLRAIKRSEASGREGLGQPGIESAAGRDRAGTELSRNFATNTNEIDVDSVAPPPGSVQGTRVTPEGDPTGAPDADTI